MEEQTVSQMAHNKKKRKKGSQAAYLPPLDKSNADLPELRIPGGGDVPYFNRELSWLAFNFRVLEQAKNDNYPLLERFRFLSFVASNLDEFFEIRVAGVVQLVDAGVIDPTPDGYVPKELLVRIHERVAEMVREKYRCWREELVPQMAKEGIHFKSREELNKREMKWIERYFETQIFPVLTPMAIDHAHPFPQLANKSLNILAWLEDPEIDEEDDRRMAIIPVPRILPRVVTIRVDGKGAPAYIFLSDILKFFADRLFPGLRLKSVHAFRITRNSDLYIDEEEIENLLLTIEEELSKMNRGAAVRLEIEEGADRKLLWELLKDIKLSPDYVFEIDGPINLMRLSSVYDVIDRPDLKFKPFTPLVPHQLARPENIFNAIAREDLYLHHPYDSFQPVVDLLQQAARDPQVLAIKLTIYRTSSDSPLIKALIEASNNGKHVTALMELKARFDEAQNIQWARQLEEEDVHVVYGITGMKTHCKCLLVVRREGDDLVRYAHLGTGNYHPKTAKLYTDMSMFTARKAITEEVAAVFNTLTGFARSHNFQQLLVAPFNLHSTMQRLILREAELAKEGKKAKIIFKCNSLVDKDTIDNLYRASQAGVEICLIIRGICCLVPGVKGLSENIEVRSVLGRFLEHSRIFYFENGDADADLYIGSADIMPRNFFRRIEVVFPVLQPSIREKILGQLLAAYIKDNKYAKRLCSDCSYKRPQRKSDDGEFSVQEHLLENVLEEQRRRAEASEQQ